MNKFNKKCDDCGIETNDGKHHHTGNYLCITCYTEWNNKEEKQKKEFIDEINKKNLDNYTKKKS